MALSALLVMVIGATQLQYARHLCLQQWSATGVWSSGLATATSRCKGALAALGAVDLC